MSINNTVSCKNIYRRQSSDYEHGEAYLIVRGTWEKTKEWMEYISFGLTCGYGVKPLRTLIVAAVLIAIFAFIFFGFSYIEPLEYEIKEKPKDPDTPHIVRGFAELGFFHRLGLCFYFSAGTFTAALFGEITPQGPFKAVAIIEGILGFLTMALFLVTLGNVWLG
ncbi:MAG: ion channel [Planctomycetota bacterium]